MSKRTGQTFSAQQLDRINVNAAGIDVGSREHFVAVPTDRDETSVRSFGTYTEDLHAIARWLCSCKVDTVALESTGVYWIPLWAILEEYQIEVLLVDARKVKNVSGRKSDQSDCQWLQTLHTYGLLAGCFRPDAQIRVLREFLRQRHMLVKMATQHVQHMHKALTLMNIQLKQVISDVTGTSGMRIIRAIVAGERNRRTLAEMRDYRLKASPEQIEKALEGDWRPEHLFQLDQALALYDFYQEKITECEQKIEEYLQSLPQKAEADALPPSSKSKRPRADDERMRQRLYVVCGVDLSQIDGIDVNTSQRLISEIGLDMTRWRTEKQFARWLGLAPDNQVSGGKVLSGRRKRKVVNGAAQALRMAAQALRRSDSALGAYFRMKLAQKGPGVAIKATAHKLAKLVYRALRYGINYVDIGQQQYTRQMEQRRIANLQRSASRLGFQLVAA